MDYQIGTRERPAGPHGLRGALPGRQAGIDGRGPIVAPAIPTASPAQPQPMLHDGLTGLPGRALFLDRLSLAMGRARRRGEGFAIAVLDIDRLAPVNDRLGHAVGDAILQGVAQRLRDSLRQEDTVARLAGDRFGLLLSATADRPRARQALRKLHQALAQPLVVDGSPLSVTLSAGVCLCDGSEGQPGAGDAAGGAGQPGLVPLERASEALRRVKRQGGDGCLLASGQGASDLDWRSTEPDAATWAGGATHALPALQQLERAMPVLKRLVRAGDRIYRAGQRFEGPYVLHAGSVKVVAACSDGRSPVVSLHLGGDWFGFDGLATGHHDCDTVATDTSEVWLLPHDALMHAGLREPTLLHLLHAEMARACQRDRDSRLALGSLPVDAKVAAFLCGHANALAQRGMRIDQIRLHLSRAELGEYLDMTLESVSRAMTQLARQGLIRFGHPGRRVLTIPDLEALQEFARTRRRAAPEAAGPAPRGDDDGCDSV